MLISLIVLVFSVIMHEISHGYVADRLGDPTARVAGRLTLNPIPHIDLFGSILLPFFLIATGSPILIGWAKPVPIDPFNLKDPRRDSALIAFAGPATNLVLAGAAALLLRLTSTSEFFIVFLTQLIVINLVLAILNLLPVSPLDGFKVVGGLLPASRAHEWYQLERYGIIFLLLLLLPLGGQSMLSAIMQPILSFLLQILIPPNALGTGII